MHVKEDFFMFCKKKIGNSNFKKKKEMAAELAFGRIFG
jgi:hypothetical protein